MLFPFTNPSAISTTAPLLHTVDQMSHALGLDVPPVVDLEQLRQLSPGTLGRCLADELDRQQLKPLTTGPRRKQLHDSVHTLTGYGTDPVGELEVQAFLLGSTFRLTHVLLGLGLLRLIHQSVNIEPQQLQKRLWQAYERGQNSSFNLDDWRPEDHWHSPLASVRLQLGI